MQSRESIIGTNGAAKKTLSTPGNSITAMVTMKQIKELNGDRPQSQWKLTFHPGLGSALTPPNLKVTMLFRVTLMLRN